MGGAHCKARQTTARGGSAAVGRLPSVAMLSRRTVSCSDPTAVPQRPEACLWHLREGSRAGPDFESNCVKFHVKSADWTIQEQSSALPSVCVSCRGSGEGLRQSYQCSAVWGPSRVHGRERKHLTRCATSPQPLNTVLALAFGRCSGLTPGSTLRGP